MRGRPTKLARSRGGRGRDGRAQGPLAVRHAIDRHAPRRCRDGRESGRVDRGAAAGASGSRAFQSRRVAVRYGAAPLGRRRGTGAGAAGGGAGRCGDNRRARAGAAARVVDRGMGERQRGGPCQSAAQPCRGVGLLLVGGLLSPGGRRGRRAGVPGSARAGGGNACAEPALPRGIGAAGQSGAGARAAAAVSRLAIHSVLPWQGAEPRVSIAFNLAAEPRTRGDPVRAAAIRGDRG